MDWKKGRGKLGVFKPLVGEWLAEAKSEMGMVKCRREFKPVLDGKYLVGISQRQLSGDRPDWRQSGKRGLLLVLYFRWQAVSGQAG